MKKCVVLTGAGISADSGLQTFRDTGGLWEGHRVQDVCTPEALERQPQKVLDFYNKRRRQAAAAEPNAAHHALVALEKKYCVQIITQNVDDLHERAGSSRVLHLHGELNKARSSVNENDIVPCLGDQTMADVDRNGYMMRPFIVFFGENVPMIERAIEEIRDADVVIVVGTSLKVYPAASLLHYAPLSAEYYLIDPHPEQVAKHINTITEKAKDGVPPLVANLLNRAV